MESVIEKEKLERERWEKETIGAKTNVGSYTIWEMRKCFDNVCDDTNWKNPISCAVHHSLVDLTTESIKFFQGCSPEIVGIQPITGYVLIKSDGYSC